MEADEHTHTQQKKKAAADWRVKSEQVNEARNKRGISADTHGLSTNKMYAQSKNDETSSSEHVAAHPENAGAGGDPCIHTSEVTPSGAGAILAR